MQRSSGPTSATAADHLLRLTSLRAFAALAVFVGHLHLRGGTVGPAGPVAQYGYLGVGFFFVLSGFVLAWSYAPGSGAAAFYLRRFARIWPSHAVVLLVAAVVPVTVVAVEPGQLVYTAALVQAWLPGVLDPYAANGVSWSLSCEAAFYAALPVVLPLVLRARPAVRWLVAGGWWAAAAAVTGWVALRAGQYGDAAYVFPPLRFGEFLLGVVAAVEVRRGWRLSGRGAGVLVAAGLALAVLGGGAYPSPVGGAGLVFLAVVVLAAQRDLSGAGGLLTRRGLVRAGQVSFAFYLVHELVLLNVSSATGLTGWTADLVLVPACVLAAYALHRCVEQPCEARLRRLRTRSGARVAATPLPVDG